MPNRPSPARHARPCFRTPTDRCNRRVPEATVSGGPRDGFHNVVVLRVGVGAAVKRSRQRRGGSVSLSVWSRCGVDGDGDGAAAVVVVTRVRKAERSHGQSDSHSVALLCT